MVVAGHRGDEAAVRSHLDDADELVREAAISALERCASLDADELHRHFGDPAARVRARAAELAARVPGADPTPLLRDEDPRVVEVSCFACGEITWEATPPPIELLGEIATTHDDALCRESAAAALGAIGDPRGLEAVLAACSDRVTVRRRATLALAAFDDPRADDALERALDDKDWQVRQAAEDLLEVGRSLDGDPDPDAYAE